MAEQLAFNTDCLEAMRKMKDNEFDLAIVDPPYGSGLASEGGCQGWFSKYHSQSVNVERERERAEPRNWNRFGQRFDRYKQQADDTQNRIPWESQVHAHTQARKCGSMESAEPGEPGRRSSQKNYCVGRSAETGIF